MSSPGPVSAGWRCRAPQISRVPVPPVPPATLVAWVSPPMTARSRACLASLHGAALTSPSRSTSPRAALTWGPETGLSSDCKLQSASDKHGHQVEPTTRRV